MRRLLLLLLTFLLPLQLLAATVVDLPPRGGQGGALVAGLFACHPAQASSLAHAIADLRTSGESAVSPDVDLQADSGAGQGGDEDVDAPAVQAELEDHTMPARIATPDIPWQSFPHAFAVPLSWPSFVRDQLRPPPLA